MGKLTTWTCDKCSAKTTKPSGWAELQINRAMLDAMGFVRRSTDDVSTHVLWCSECLELKGIAPPERGKPEPVAVTFDDLLYDMVGEMVAAHQS